MLSTASVASVLSARPAGPEDCEFLAALRNELAAYFFDPAPATVEKTRELIEASLTYVVERDGRRVASFAFYGLDGEGAGEFGRFMVAPTYWRGGTGMAVMEMALRLADRLGLHRLHVALKDRNDRARQLYERVGFVQTAMRLGVIEMVRAL